MLDVVYVKFPLQAWCRHCGEKVRVPTSFRCPNCNQRISFHSERTDFDVAYTCENCGPVRHEDCRVDSDDPRQFRDGDKFSGWRLGYICRRCGGLITTERVRC